MGVMRRFYLLLFPLLLAVSCEPKVFLNIENPRTPLGEHETIAVMNERTEAPDSVEYIGNVRVQTHYSYLLGGTFRTKHIAKEETRKAGGNIMKINYIYEHFPFYFGFLYDKDEVAADIYYAAPGSAFENVYKTAVNNPVPQFDMRKFEINVGIGGEALYASEEFLVGVMDVRYSGPETATEMYNGCYDAEISPTVSVEWAYNLNRFWSVVGSLGGSRVRASYFDPFNNAFLNSETAYMFDVLAGIRYRWEHSKNFSLYSQLQLGGTFNTPAEYWSRNEMAQNHFGFQITGLGLTFGSRLFGLAEFGWGTEYFGVAVVTGARVGLGYKF